MISFATDHPLTGLVLAFRHLSQTIRAVPVRRRTKAQSRSGSGQVTLLHAGPGSADLITLRGLRAVEVADSIFHDRLADAALLIHARHGAMLVPVGKAPDAHSLSQDQINAHLVHAAPQGLRAVRLKCSDPGVFGHGAEEAPALDAAGIAWSIVLGVTGACAVAAAAGSFLTERGVTERVILATGQCRAVDATDWASCAAPGLDTGQLYGCCVGGADSGQTAVGRLAR